MGEFINEWPEGMKVDHDYTNAWFGMRGRLDAHVLGELPSDEVITVSTYEERIRKTNPPDAADAIMARSDPNAVRGIDIIVHEFNALPSSQIKIEKYDEFRARIRLLMGYKD